ncbi:hypothetical protein [Lysinibacillus xylanilyticus]|uniref:hypothetical protein n=1 Tax=Lysinibacillus xylanilyticus TaxID=582475 RepID=UPI00380CD2A4
MPSAILGTRKGSTSTSVTYSAADLLKMETATAYARQYLGTKTAESTMANAMSGINMAAALGEVFGETSAATVANRIAVHVWPETSVKDELAKGAATGASNMGTISNKVQNGGYKSVTLTLTRKEAYNLVSQRTVLSVVDSVTAITYNK